MPGLVGAVARSWAAASPPGHLTLGHRDRPHGDVETFCHPTSHRLGEAEFMQVTQGKTFYLAKTHSSPS